MTGSGGGGSGGGSGSGTAAPSASGSGSGSGSASASSTNTACAACKYQRRKCTPDCPLSPYFPPDQPKRFQNVHKLFGVSNILRILKHVDPSKREDTVKSIAYEADTREKDPVHGCLGVITILQNQVSKLKDELAVARDQLYMLQQQHNFHHQQAQMQQIVGSLGGSTSVVNVSSAQENTVLMQHLQQYNHDMNQLGSDFAKSNPLPIASFEPDHYLRNDNFDIKPPSTSRFDVARYIRGESPVQHQQHQQQQQSPMLLQESSSSPSRSVKEEQQQQRIHRNGDHRSMHGNYGFGMAGDSGSNNNNNNAFTDSTSTGDHATLLQQSDATDAHQHAFDATQDRYAMAIRRRGGSSSSHGLLNLTVASDAELRRASAHHHVGVPEHELRSAGVYLTLTNN